VSESDQVCGYAGLGGGGVGAPWVSGPTQIEGCEGKGLFGSCGPMGRLCCGRSSRGECLGRRTRPIQRI